MNNKNRIVRTEEDLKRDFISAFKRLVWAGKNYDEGYFDDALNIATLVYMFVYDHGSTKSLLTHLKRKNIQFFNTHKFNTRNLMPEMPLVKIRMTTQALTYQPVFQDLPVESFYSSFPKWWDGLVLSTINKTKFSRKNLIFHFRNTIGGGHVDDFYNPKQDNLAIDFADLSKSEVWGWHKGIIGEGQFVPEYGAHYATIRQIGWELEQTIRNSCPDLIESLSMQPMRQSPMRQI